MSTRYLILLILRLLIIFRIAISVFCFLDLGRERFVSLARYAHRSLLQVPEHLAHTCTDTLMLYISRVPDHSRLPTPSYFISAGFLTIPV